MNTGERKKKTRERIYMNILFYGSVIRGLHLRLSVPARKAIFSRTANVFCGSAGCGSARDALNVVATWRGCGSNIASSYHIPYSLCPRTSVHPAFVLSQSFKTLTNFIGKSSSIYGTKLVSLDSF